MSRAGTTTRNKAATLKDVARLSGFAASTVSIALNGAPLAQHLLPATVKQIKAAAKRLGYRPHESARSLVMRRSHSIGVVVIDLSDPYCMLILKGIDQQLQKSGYLPLIMDAHNDREHFKQCVDTLIERRVEGLIVVANWLFLDVAALRELPERHLPTVVVGRDLHRSQLPSVLVDNESGAYDACRHLFELGHRDIAFLLGPTRIADSNSRWKGVQRFAAEAGLHIAPGLVHRMSNTADPLGGFAAGRAMTHELLETGLKMSAIVCFDDLTALGAIRALDERGKRVPRDCSVIGFDDVPMASLSSPALTTIRQPMDEMGRFAAKSLLALCSGKARRTRAGVTLLAPEIVVRASTAKIRP